MREDMNKAGAGGVMAGKARGELSDANRPQAAMAPGPSGSYGAVVHGAKDKEAFEQDSKEVLSTVRQSADQTVYKKGQVWMTPEAAKLDMQKDADKIKTIERYSDEYFELVHKNTPAENQLLSMQKESEQLLLVLRGQAYLIK
jgi:Ca-activated chloride channel family protein